MDNREEARDRPLIPSRWHRERERGAALVELALISPIVALFAVGVVDVGRAYQLKARLTNAVREGAVFAQYFPSRVDNSRPECADPGNIAFAVRNEAGQSYPFGVSVRRAADGTPITGCETSAVARGSSVVISASTPFDVMSPVAAAVVGRQLTLRAELEVVVQ
jgi:Flp pilus assembly pilin Flp